MRALHGEKRGGLREVSLICFATVPGYAQLCTANLRRLPRKIAKVNHHGDAPFIAINHGQSWGKATL